MNYLYNKYNMHPEDFEVLGHKLLERKYGAIVKETKRVVSKPPIYKLDYDYSMTSKYDPYYEIQTDITVKRDVYDQICSLLGIAYTFPYVVKDAEYLDLLKKREGKERKIREKNAAVKKAYDHYQMLLKIAESEM